MLLILLPYLISRYKIKGTMPSFNVRKSYTCSFNTISAVRVLQEFKYKYKYGYPMRYALKTTHHLWIKKANTLLIDSIITFQP